MGVWLQLNDCCYCISLRTGSFIILWLGLIYSTLGLVEAIYGIQSVSAGAAPEMILFSVANCAGVLTLGMAPCALALYGVYLRRSGYLKLYVFIAFVTIICWMSITIGLAFQWIQVYHFEESVWTISVAILIASYATSVVEKPNKTKSVLAGRDVEKSNDYSDEEVEREEDEDDDDDEVSSSNDEESDEMSSDQNGTRHYGNDLVPSVAINAISNALEKADKYSKKLETVVRTADIEIPQWKKHIDSIKEHLVGWGSIISFGYTIWPLIRDFRQKFKQIAQISWTVARWFIGSKPSRRKVTSRAKQKPKSITPRQRRVIPSQRTRVRARSRGYGTLME